MMMILAPLEVRTRALSCPRPARVLGAVDWGGALKWWWKQLLWWV